jgi:hypothetical protein
MCAAEGRGPDPADWIMRLEALRHASFEWSEGLDRDSRKRAGKIWLRVNECAAGSVRRLVVRRQLEVASRHSALRALSERLGGIYDTAKQMAVVSAFLSRLGVSGCRVSVFSKPENPIGEARLLLDYGAGLSRDLPPEGLPYPAPELAGGSASAGMSRLAMALHAGDVRIGFVVFEIGRKEDALICELLRWQISAALKGSTDIRAEKTAAAEKATLLKELQHRLKNSMSLIAGIASLESREASSHGARIALDRLRSRIAAVGDLYEALFYAGGIENVDLAEYLTRVADSAAGGIGTATGA